MFKVRIEPVILDKATIIAANISDTESWSTESLERVVDKYSSTGIIATSRYMCWSSGKRYALNDRMNIYDNNLSRNLVLFEIAILVSHIDANNNALRFNV